MELENCFQPENLTDKTVDLNDDEEEVQITKKVVKISEIEKNKKPPVERKKTPEKAMTPDKKKSYSAMFKQNKPPITKTEETKRESVSPAPKARFIPNKNKGSTPKRDIAIKGSGNYYFLNLVKYFSLYIYIIFRSFRK